MDSLTSSRADVTTLIAPSGYGKTTTLGQWTRMTSEPFAWLRARREDNSVKYLLTHLAASLKVAGVATIEDLRNLQFMDEQEAMDHGAGHLSNYLETSPLRPVMILDDVDVLRSRASIGLIAELVRQLEGTCRVVIASHSTPKIGLPVIRAGGRLLEITDEQLAFNPEEVRELTRELGIDQKVAGDIMEATEGWPAAVFLKAVALRDPKTAAANIRIPGQRHLTEFVQSEIIPSLSVKRRQFLTSMSLLERMSGSLCDAALESSESARLLTSLEGDTHLVHHLDEDGIWFGMNRVLRDALRSGLERDEPDRARVIHARASAWYEANAMPLEAIGHAQRAEDVELFARLLGHLIKIRYTTGHVVEVLQWMEWLEGHIPLHTNPRLAAIGALVHLQEGNVLETERWLDAASVEPADGDTRAVTGLVRAATTRRGLEEMFRDIDGALEAAAPGSPWLPAILVTKGLAHLISGETDDAERCFFEVGKIGLENQSLSSLVLALGQRALIAIGRQDWELAGSLSNRAVAVIDEYALDGYQSSGLALIAAARCARRDNDIASSLTLLSRASMVRPRLSIAMPAESVLILLEMAKAHIELSDVAGARAVIREAEDIVRQRPGLGSLPAALESAKDALAHLGPNRGVLPAMTKAELRLLPLLATHMSFPEIGEQLFVSRHTVKSQATSIYRKLGSSTRSEAVARAHDLGLLSR